ncbi:transmembrane protein 186 [Fopius arisanus]|uniref:Transmembrane protein 186 n=1 Tax=Fopius arisanus TaxID=64838 RepID=A0A0C9RJ28_9HYME|nr:PREDICTED: transmembrane protein 186 [Fopius arisanus]
MVLFTNNCWRMTFTSRNFLRSSAVSYQLIPHQKASKKYESKKWPGYHVIYNLENVKTISILNRLKLHTTIVSGVTIPMIITSEVTLGLTSAFVHNATFLFGAVALFLHGVGYFANNVVGIIYAKKDSDDLKIAYVSYFGKRMDIDTNFNDISSPEPKTRFRSPIFTPLFIASKKKNLRLFIKGKIIDEQKFDKLLGVSF